MLDQRRLDFIDWLCGVGRLEGQTQADYARDVVGVDPSRLVHWKAERDFLRRWDERMRELHGHPQTLSDQLEALHELALGGREVKASDQIRAIETYWKLLGKLAPKQVDHRHTVGAVRELSDGELERAIGPSPEDDETPALGVVVDGG